MSRLEEALARMKELEKEIFQLRRFGRDRFGVGDVIRFTRTYGNGNTYTYAAVKVADDKWFTTASEVTTRHRYTYDQLIQFIIQHPAAATVEVATAWVDVTEATDDVLTADMPAGHAPVVRASAVRGETQYSYVDPASLK